MTFLKYWNNKNWNIKPNDSYTEACSVEKNCSDNNETTQVFPKIKFDSLKTAHW